MLFSRFVLLCLMLLFSCTLNSENKANQISNYKDLEKLFKDWREFEKPPTLDGAPDYTKSQFDKSKKNYQLLRNRLEHMDTTNWPVHHKVDWHIVLAEMNGY